MPERFIRNGEVWKRCPGCHIDKPYDADHYYRDGVRSSGEQKYTTRCRECLKVTDKKNRSDQSLLSRERQKRRMRARQRAWVRLGQEWPERFQELYEEELFREGPEPRTAKE